MARIVQVLLPLVAVALVKAQLPHIPFFDNIPGLSHPSRPISERPKNERITHRNSGYNSGYDSWFQHFGNPDTHQFSSESHETQKSYENFDPFFHEDPYYPNNGWGQMPGVNNVFNIPNLGYHSHRPPHKGKDPQDKPKQDHKGEQNFKKSEKKPKEILPVDKKPTELENSPKQKEANIGNAKKEINEAKIQDPINNEEVLPPKTNEVKKKDDKGGKDDDKMGIDKKKDFLLVGQGNNAKSVYLLHENKPNPTTVISPNPNQPGNNIIYVPYNPGQSNNQAYQVINGQPAQSNLQMMPDKLGVSNGYSNSISNPGQSTTNLNAGTQNPGYVTIYSNGQFLQIPGVVVNNVPVQNGNQLQRPNYIIANTVPNSGQTMQAIQNPGTNVIYATIPNQPSNGPIYVQIPNCVNGVSNSCGSSANVPNQGINNGMTNNGLPANMVVYQVNPNTGTQPGASNGYVQQNMVGNQGQGAISVAIPNNQNMQYQTAVQLPVGNAYSQPIVSSLGQGQNSPSQGNFMNNENIPMQNMNGYNQPILSNQVQGQTVPNQGQKQEVPYQSMINNQNIPYQSAVQMPINSGTNGYALPMVSNQAQEQNAPIQGTMVSNQNTPEQSGVVIPIPSGYDHPLITNPIIESRGDMTSNQNGAQPMVTVNSDPNDQGTQVIVNTPSNTEVINQESDISKPLVTSSLVLDGNNSSSLGAQPAIMISDFKDKPDGKKDKNRTKNEKEKKEKEEKKDQKPEDDKKPKDSEPFTNQNKEK